MVVRIVQDRRDLEFGGRFLKNVSEGIAEGLTNPQLRRAAREIGQIYQDEIEKSASKAFRSSTQRLARSFTVQVRPRTAGFDILLSSDKPYARIQDEGGIVRPRSQEFLTVPLTPKAKGRRARDFPGIHRRGRALFQKNEALFALVKQVRIPATRYLQKAARNGRDRVARELGAGIRALVRAARRR